MHIYIYISYCDIEFHKIKIDKISENVFPFIVVPFAAADVEFVVASTNKTKEGNDHHSSRKRRRIREQWWWRREGKERMALLPPSPSCCSFSRSLIYLISLAVSYVVCWYM
jgi:hypothetical protein